MLDDEHLKFARQFTHQFLTAFPPLSQIAHKAGYIKINWNAVDSDIETAKKQVCKKAEKELPKILEKAKDFVTENLVLAGSYIGGFFIGLSSS